MKKILLTVALSTAFAAVGFGQGYVGLANGTASKISANATLNGSTFTATGTTAGSYYFALFYAPSTDVSVSTVNGATSSAISGTSSLDTVGSFIFNDSSWTLDSSVLGVVGTRAGFIGDSTGSAQSAVPVAAGVTEDFVLLGWSGNIGSTVASVESFLNGQGPTTGWIGESAVGSQVVSAGAPSPVPPIWGSAPQIPGFTLGEVQPIPEPSTIALGVMGAAALLALRRKKA